MTTAFTPEQLIEATQGTWVSSQEPFQSARVWTDTRSIGPGDFFLPLSGERFDGHDYLLQALEKGAIGAFVAKQKWQENPAWKNSPNLIVVEDPLTAYLNLGRFHRQHTNPKVIGVAGSSGKTTTKEMLYAALSPLAKTQCTQKNHNNEVGVSQTLLAIKPDTQIAIVEMAMRAPGEIRILTENVLPDIALVTNIGPEHIEFFRTLDAIAQAECEIFDGLNPQTGLAVFNADDTLLAKTTQSQWHGQTQAFALAEATDIEITPHLTTSFTYKKSRITLQVAGNHNIMNALAVLKIGEALGFSVDALAQGLAQFQPVEGRGNKITLSQYKNTWLINDAYNANPDSMRAAIETLLAAPKNNSQRVVVLGPMKELGDLSQQYHQELGQWLATKTGIDYLFTVDPEGAWIANEAQEAAFPVCHSENKAGLIAAIKKTVPSLDETVFLVKASRACQLETLAEAL